MGDLPQPGGDQQQAGGRGELGPGRAEIPALVTTSTSLLRKATAHGLTAWFTRQEVLSRGYEVLRGPEIVGTQSPGCR